MTLSVIKPKNISTILSNFISKMMCAHQTKYAQLICSIENVLKSTF